MSKVKFEQLQSEITTALKNGSFQTVIEQASGMVALAQHLGVEKYILLGRYYLGFAYHGLHEYNNSMAKYLQLTNRILNEAVDLQKLELKPGFLDHVRYGMAANMCNLGDLDGTAIVLNHVLKTSLEPGIVLDSIILLGSNYLTMYEVSKNDNFLMVTLEMYLSLLEEGGLPRQKEAMIHTNLAILFAHQGDYAKAQDMLNRAYLQVTEPAEFLSIYNEMIRIHLITHSLEKARKNLEKASTYLKHCSGTPEEWKFYILTGILRKEEENYVEAQRLLEKGYLLARYHHNWSVSLSACRELVTFYEKINQPKNAEIFGEFKELKENVNLVKEVVAWEKVWQDIKERLLGETVLR